MSHRTSGDVGASRGTGLWLNAIELAELTGYRYRSRQCAALARMGIAFRSRDSDGFPLVLRSLFESLTEQQKLRARRPRAEPRLDLGYWVQQPRK